MASPHTRIPPRSGRITASHPKGFVAATSPPAVDPTFLVIGAQKCATTWLAEMLRQHPEVCVPDRKEVHFFDKASNYAKGIAWYRRQFGARRHETAVGEATPNYFWTPSHERERVESGHQSGIPALIHRQYPWLNLVLMLRDPVNRAVSAYCHHIRARRVKPWASIFQVAHQYGILSMGHYEAQLREWLRYFPRQQLRVLVVEEDIAPDPARAVRRMYRFLGVDPAFRPYGLDERIHRRSGGLFLHLNYHAPRLARLLRIEGSPLERVNLPRVGVSRRDVDRLTRYYAEGNRRLEDLLERPLEAWRRPASPRGQSSSPEIADAT